MYFQTNLTKITITASVPPWAKVVHLDDGTEGFFADTNFGDKVFLTAKNHVIWLPKSLRGRKVESLTPDELKMIPKEDSGKFHYDNWRSSNDKNASIEKLFNGYSFTDTGKALLARLIKLVDKYELNNTGNLGIDQKYSINPSIFDKLLQSNNHDDVKRWGRVIGKKFVTLLHVLNQVNPKIAKRLDADFMFAFKKFIPVFDFDPITYQPVLPEQKPEQIDAGVGMAEIYPMLLEKAIKEIKPLMSKDLVFFPIMKGFVKLLGAMKTYTPDALPEYRKMFDGLIDQLIEVGNQGQQNAFSVDPSVITQQIVQSPALIEFHSLLLDDGLMAQAAAAGVQMALPTMEALEGPIINKHNNPTINPFHAMEGPETQHFSVNPPKATTPAGFTFISPNWHLDDEGNKMAIAKNDNDSPINEALVYQLSRHLAPGLVPDTVLRSHTPTGIHSNELHSIQRKAPGQTFGNIVGGHELDHPDMHMMRILDYLVSNRDRHMYNYMHDTPTNKFFAIDNGGSMNYDDSDALHSILGYIKRQEGNVPEDFIHRINTANPKQLKKIFTALGKRPIHKGVFGDRYFTPSEAYGHFSKRLNNLKNIFARNGNNISMPELANHLKDVHQQAGELS